jgi:hypothetical protein
MKYVYKTLVEWYWYEETKDEHAISLRLVGNLADTQNRVTPKYQCIMLTEMDP